MGCADICLSHDYDGANAFNHEKVVTARKAHACCECGESIDIGEQYERASGKSDGYVFTERTCLVCREIRKAFVCGTWVFGMLWNSMCEDMFPMWRRVGPFDCLAKLTTEEAVAECTRRFREWQGEDDES